MVRLRRRSRLVSRGHAKRFVFLVVQGNSELPWAPGTRAGGLRRTVPSASPTPSLGDKLRRAREGHRRSALDNPALPGPGCVAHETPLSGARKRPPRLFVVHASTDSLAKRRRRSDLAVETRHFQFREHRLRHSNKPKLNSKTCQNSASPSTPSSQMALLTCHLRFPALPWSQGRCTKGRLSQPACRSLGSQPSLLPWRPSRLVARRALRRREDHLIRRHEFDTGCPSDAL